MDATIETPPPSSPPDLAAQRVSANHTLVYCCGCRTHYTFAGRPQRVAMAESLERQGWEFRGDWYCPRCPKEAHHVKPL